MCLQKKMSEPFHSESDFKIQGGGMGLFVNIMAFGFFLCIFLASLYEIFISSTNHEPKDVFFILTLSTFFCIYGSIVAYKYWKSNYIEISNDMLRISVFDRQTRRVWPKYNKTALRLDDIESASLKKPATIVMSPCLKINTENKKPFYVDTKPFSKAGFYRLFSELELRGVKVNIEAGSI